jgi:hypothetical protein
MPWTVKTISSPLSPAVNDIATATQAGASSVQTLLDAAVVLLDAAKIFFQSGTDPFKLIYEPLVSQVETLINDFFGTGLFELVIDPFKIFPGEVNFETDKNNIPILTPGNCINLAIQSFDDQGDPNRPQFGDTTDVSGWGFLITAPNIELFKASYEEFVNFWKSDIFDYSILEIEKRRAGPVVYSKKPDWSSLRLNQIEDLNTLNQALLTTLSTLRGYIAVADDIINDTIDSLTRKIDQLNVAIALLQDAIDSLSKSLNIYTFDLPLGTGGVNRIKAELPDEALTAAKNNKYSMLALYIGGSSSAAAAELIRGLMFSS